MSNITILRKLIFGFGICCLRTKNKNKVKDERNSDREMLGVRLKLL